MKTVKFYIGTLNIIWPSLLHHSSVTSLNHRGHCLPLKRSSVSNLRSLYCFSHTIAICQLCETIHHDISFFPSILSFPDMWYCEITRDWDVNEWRVGSNICEAGSVRLKMSGSHLVNRYFSATFSRNVFRFDNLLLLWLSIYSLESVRFFTRRFWKTSLMQAVFLWRIQQNNNIVKY